MKTRMATKGKAEKARRPHVPADEQETIILFDKASATASIFTYEATWQRHLEQRLGLKPTMDNGYGGKEYKINKNRIPMPRVKRVLSAERKATLARILKNARRRRQGVLPL